VLLAQADLGCHSTLSRGMTLRVVIIFRITATMRTLALVGGSETFVEGFEGRAVSASAEGRHVEDVTDRHTTVDTAMSPELAAIEVVRREPYEGGDLLAAHLPAAAY
jgi:hypothetical protein